MPNLICSASRLQDYTARMKRFPLDFMGHSGKMTAMQKNSSTASVILIFNAVLTVTNI